jgi:hypothetical protein
MAFEIHQTPTNKYLMTGSPIIVVAGDSVITSTDYRVVIQVKVWEGDDADAGSITPTVILDKVQDASGRTKFDVSTIVDDIFNPPQPTLSSNYQFTGEGTCFNLQMNIGYDENTGSGFQSSLTTTIYKVTSGYAVYPEAINDFGNSVATQVAEDWLSVRPLNETFIDGEIIQLSAFWQGDSIASSDRFRLDGDSTGIGTVTVNGIFSEINDDVDPPVDAPGYTLGMNFMSPVFYNRYSVDTTKPFFISLYNLSTTTHYSRKTCSFRNALCDIGSDTIFFINRFGVWDFMQFYAIQRQGLDVQRDSFNRRVSKYNASNEVTYDNQVPQDSVYRVRANRSYEVNTGWITEDYNPLMEDLMTSSRWFSNNLNVAIRLENQEFTQKLESDVDLISYTFKFKVANPHIQNIL